MKYYRAAVIGIDRDIRIYIGTITTQKFICVMHVSSDNIDRLPINARVWGGCDAGVTLGGGCRSIAANPHNQQNRSRVSLAPARPCCVPLARDNRG